MKELQRKLMMIYCAMIGGSVVFGLVLEMLGVRATSAWKADEMMQFYGSMLAVIYTLGAIPLALRMFKCRKVADELKAAPVKGLDKWAVLRLAILHVALLLNIVLFELFDSVSYFYLAVITLLAFAFVVPSLDRCQHETSCYDDQL